MSDREFSALRELVYGTTGIALVDSKRALLAGRLERRLRARGLRDFSEYLRVFQSPDEATAELPHMISCVTTNVTHFFREPHHFELLAGPIVEDAASQTPGRLRIWSAACSTGEEPYSIAMTLLETVGHRGRVQVEIDASDIDLDALAVAERGVYSASRVANIPKGILGKYFARGTGEDAGSFIVSDAVKEHVRFFRLNFQDPRWPVRGRYNAIFCRNVAIYFDRATQERLFHRLATHILPGGRLILGHSESLHWLSDVYVPEKATVYRVRTDGRAQPQSPPEALEPTTLPCVRIGIGGVHVAEEPAEIRTVLGSCVAACIFDPQAAVGGMNHFALVHAGDSRGSTRYGDNAMRALVDKIVALGGRRERLQCKAFGASQVLRVGEPNRAVPESNAQFVRAWLSDNGIPLVAEKMGGTLPLAVRFETHNGRVLVKALDVGQTPWDR